jgi:galactokinase
MPSPANVSSVEALEAFRASLILYLSKARPALEEVNADVLRLRVWLQTEQRIHWENQLRRRKRELEDAQQALFSAKLSNLREATSAELQAVQKAKRRLDEAEEKLRRIKHWAREFDHRSEPLVKELERLHTALAADLPQAIAWLAQAVKTLDAYASVAAPKAAESGAARSAKSVPAAAAEDSHSVAEGGRS